MLPDEARGSPQQIPLGKGAHGSLAFHQRGFESVVGQGHHARGSQGTFLIHRTHSNERKKLSRKCEIRQKYLLCVLTLYLKNGW